MTALTLTRTLTGLAPADDTAAAVIRKIPCGESVLVDIRRPRSHKRLRLWWATANLLFQNCDQFRSQEIAHQWMKLQAGHATVIVSKTTGEEFLVADSIAFSRLDETEFNAVWQRACKAICEHILPTLSQPDLENEILRIVGGVTP